MCMHESTMCMHVSIFCNCFSTVQNLGVMKKMIVAQEGPMLTRKTFCSSGVICVCMWAHCTYMCMYISTFGINFQTVQNLGVMKKIEVLQEGTMYTPNAFLGWYVHACKRNAHKLACMFLYLAIAFQQCIIWQWWRKWKFLRRVQCILIWIIWWYNWSM